MSVAPAGAQTNPAEESAQRRAAILVVDDNAANLLAFEAILRPLGQPIAKVKSGKDALQFLLQNDVALILLDVQMPEMTGFELAAMLRSHPRLSGVPIIFVTAINRDSTHVFSGYAHGAVDYVLKPVEPEMLRARVNVFLELHRKQIQIREQAARLHQHELLELERRTEDRFRRLAESMPMPLLGVRPNGSVYICNASWTTFSGATAAETGVFMTTRWIHPQDFARAEELWSEGLKAMEPFEIECRLQSGGARAFRWHLLRAVPERGDGALEGHWIVAGVDIDDKKTAEQERLRVLEREQRAREEAEAANRMKDEFLATVSHELRTPLNAILGWARIVRASPLDPKLTRAIETIERNAQAQARLINDILDVSRIVVGKLRLQTEELDLAKVIGDAVDTVRPAADAKNIQLHWAQPPWAARFMGDSARVQQIVWNLVSNAVKFTPKGGSVAVELERDGDVARVSVRDTGIGISSEFLPHVFDRFRQNDATTCRAHDGLGLGLSIVKHLAELHGGKVTASSDGLGLGATFALTLPLGGRPAERLPRSEREAFRVSQPSTPIHRPAAELARLEGTAILFVDDFPETRDFVQTLFGQCGARIVCVETAEQAMREMETSIPDVLISDIGLPGEDGYSLIRRIRALPTGAGGDVPAIALTGCARPEDQRKATDEGFHVHLAKPVDPMELVSLVGSLIAKRSERASAPSHERSALAPARAE